MTQTIKNNQTKERHDLIRKIDTCDDEQEKKSLEKKLSKLNNVLFDVEEKMETKEKKEQVLLKCTADMLKTFLEKSTVEGFITDSKLVFGKDGLSVESKDMAGIIAVKSFLDKSNFNSYNETEINVKNNKNFIQALSTFGKNVINIVKEDNMVKLLDENGGFDFVESEETTCLLDSFPKLEFGEPVNIDKNVAKDIITKNNIIKSEKIDISTEKRQLTLSVGKDVDKANVKTSFIGDEKFKTSFNFDYFSKVVNVLNDLFDLYLSSETPVKFSEKTDKYAVDYYLCPITLIE